MNLRVQLVIAMALLCTMAVFAQNPITADSPFQVKYIGNLAAGDSVVNITNTGATGGNICVNVYTFSPDEQEISCCACVVTPNGLVSLSAKQDLVNNTLTPAVPGSIVVKLLATTDVVCNAATPTTIAFVGGMAAWGTSLHIPPFAASTSVTETAFTPSTLSLAEFTRLSSLCTFIQTNGSGFGICRSCRSGALGGAKK